MFIDSHCHLTYPEFVKDREEVIQNARDAKVEVFHSICTKFNDYPDLIRLVEKYSFIYASVGIHPHEVEKETSLTVEALIERAQHPKIISIGETGLDYHYDHSPREHQKESFRMHIQVSQKLGLPLVIHTRNAEEDTLSLLKEALKTGPVTGVIHCFTASAIFAEQVLALGFYISIAGIITFKNAEELRKTVERIPINRLLIETDSPFLAPMPHRGKRNEPSFVTHVARQIGVIKGISIEKVAQETTSNFYALFTKSVTI